VWLESNVQGGILGTLKRQVECPDPHVFVRFCGRARASVGL
jgi:hypothetical protein